MANTFNEDGTYNKTEWKTGDIITADKLDKIESSLETINNNDINRHIEVDSRLDILEERMNNIKNYVTYEEFGVVCDGVYDDGVAIKATHEYANANGLKVIATGKTYYIKETIDIPIMTDTDFNGATFIIDDRVSTDKEKGVFVVNSKYDSVVCDTDYKLDKLTKRIPELSGNGLCLVEVFNDDVKHFIRFGANANSGKSQRDYFIIDNDGNVLNDIMWDFENISSTVLYPIDDNFITISNGHFITLPNNDELESQYYKRGIHVKRSNVILQCISHELHEEAPGSPYDGFLYFEKSAYLHIRDCVLQSRMLYNRESDGVNMGSYDIQFNGCVNINLYNIVDRAFHDDRWGIHKFAWSKDAIVEKCKLTRIDAHEGIYNLKIRDSLLGHHGIRIVGGGLCEIDNVDILGSSCLVSLRADYGSFWDGDMYIRNVKFTPGPITYTPKLLDIENIGTHYFGYDCVAPRKLVVENVTIDDTLVKATEGTTYSNMFLLFNTDEKIGNWGDITYFYKFIEHAEFRNIKTTSGSGFKVFYKAPSNLYLDKEHIIETISKIDEANKQLYIKPNMNVIIDNVELVDFPNGINGDSNNMFSYTGEIDTDWITNTKHACVPKLTISNCNNICAGLNDVPIIFNVKNSVINRLTATKYDKTMMMGVADNCVFDARVSSSIEAINPNWYGFTFVNCHFNKPSIAGVETSDISSIVKILGFPGKFRMIDDVYFRASVKMVNCTMFDIDFTELNSHTRYMNFNFGNHNFEYHFRTRGWDTTRPDLSGKSIPVGFIYYIQSTDRFIIWTGEKWNELQLVTAES